MRLYMNTAIKPGYLRVTQVLSFFSNFHKIDPNVLKNAANRGKLVHQIIEGIQEGFGKEDIPESAEGYINSFEIWAEGKVFLPKPPRLYCDQLMITGEPDDIYKDGDELVLVDYKTPQNESKTWAMQAAAYDYLCKKSGYPITRREFVKLNKSGKAPKVYTYKDDIEMFLKILESYRYFSHFSIEESDFNYL